MIRSNYTESQTPQFRVLNDGQCQELFLAALECLNRVGVQVNNAEARDLLAGAGARVQDKIVRIPPHIIQDALALAPKTFTIWGRDYQHCMHAAPENVYFGPGPSCTYFVDPTTAMRRRALKGDAGLTARVCDALEHIDYIMGLSLFDDVTPILSPVYEFAESVANTTKPIMAWANNPDNFLDIYQIALAVVGDEKKLREKPIFGYFATYESPLRLADEPIANTFLAAQLGIPCILLGGATIGMESPFTGASALVISLATALAGVATVQLKQRGAPIAIGMLGSAMDMRTARPSYGSPEMSLYAAASAELARYLKLPFMGTAAASESKLVDAQAGVEATMQVLMSALSGGGIVHDVGFLDCADIGSLQYVILADEIIGMVKRILRGVTVNPQTIMLDLIEKVGPGGNFITEPRSVALCRSETWVPSVLDREPHVKWEQKGSKDTAQRLQEKLQKILESHQPAPLSGEATEKIQAILVRAEERTQSSE